MLSPKAIARVDLLFQVEERQEVARLLKEQCGNNLPFLEKLNCYELERYQFAALKLSHGDLSKLRKAIKLAQLDWRDLLMSAGFGDDIHAHGNWMPLSQNDNLP